jgi:histidinol-phosphatase
MTKTIDFGPQWSASLRQGPEAELRGWVDAALAWCVETDAIAMHHFRKTSPERKPDRTFVTEADTSIEERLREKIKVSFPKHGIVGEELGDEPPKDKAATRWYIDPIDGTHNFMRGLPQFATLLAVERDGEVQAGVISAPALGQRWYATRGGGAWVVGGPANPPGPRRLHTSSVDDLGRAQVLYRSLGDMNASRVAAGFQRLVRAVWRERGFGDFWGYTLVADGVAEAMIEQDLHPWDLAAPWVLVEEAGGRITDFDGRRSFERGEGFATNGLLHDAVLGVLRERSET